MTDILVLTQTYPSESEKYQQTYVHTRLLQYVSQGLDFKVLSFSALSPYTYQGIDVLDQKTAEREFKSTKIPLLISHAPNLRNHVRWMWQHRNQIQAYIWFIHGHEVLNKHKYYPPPYFFQKGASPWFRVLDKIYDLFKLRAMKHFITMNASHLHFVFVSQWMHEHTLKNLKLQLQSENYTVIPNATHPVFIEQSYTPAFEKPLKPPYRLITIRPLDGPKYAIDVVVNLAKKHPDCQFDIYGKGQFFSHIEKPKNLRHIERFLEHTELPQLLNQYHAALMPTRLDAQGVMMCEMATFGIPVITSDLPICKEMLSPFSQTVYFNNETLDVDLKKVLSQALKSNPTKTPPPFSFEQTVQKEIELIQKTLN